MYYEYWGLNKPPFDNVPDPAMYVESHESVENTIAETLFAIEEGNECIAVIVGDVGLGKTMSLRMILDSLDQDKYRIAFVTNPDMSFIQLLREIVGQLAGAQCEMKGRVALLEKFNRLLFEASDQGKKVLVFIDEANALTPANLESVRLLTNMQDDTRNLLTIILAGQLELAQRLEHPKRANLFQRIGTYSRLDKIRSEELLKNYVETRLRLAGGTRPVFTDDAIHGVWESSDHGVPRLINKICKLCLKAGETNGLSEIDGKVVRQIAERFERLTGPAVQKRKPRKQAPARVAVEDQPVFAETATTDRPEYQAQEQGAEVGFEEPGGLAEETSGLEAQEQAAAEALVEGPAEERAAPAFESAEEAPSEPAPHKPEQAPPVVQAQASEVEDLYIAGTRIPVIIPPQVLEQIRTAPKEYRDRTAGVLAAQTLEKHHSLISSVAKDPVAVWGQIKDFILLKFEQQKAA